MAHTDRDDDNSPNIIQQKPPPPPRREDDTAERPAVDPQAPTEPGERQPAQTPFEAPPQQPIAPKVASAPSSSRRHMRKPSGHLVLSAPMHDIDPVIIDRAGTRTRMKSDPLTLIDYPRTRPALHPR